MLPDSLKTCLWKKPTSAKSSATTKYAGITSVDMKVNAFSEGYVHPEDLRVRAALEKKSKVKAPTLRSASSKTLAAMIQMVRVRGTPLLDFDDNVIALYGTPIFLPRRKYRRNFGTMKALQMIIWR
jgi:hypothetical protein